jgi:hypothetical protein
MYEMCPPDINVVAEWRTFYQMCHSTRLRWVANSVLQVREAVIEKARLRGRVAEVVTQPLARHVTA